MAGPILALLGVALHMAAAVIGGASATVAHSHAHQILAFETRLGIAWEGWARAHLVGTPLASAGFEAFYALAYWPALAGSLWWCWRRNRQRFRLLRDAMVFSGLVGMLSATSYPVAPPRLLAGYEPVARPDAVVAAIAHPELIGNPDAAMPSFHAGWFALALGVAAAACRRRRAAAASAGASGLMVEAVLATANHYLLDVLAGLLLCGLSVGVAAAWGRWRRSGAGKAGGPHDRPAPLPTVETAWRQADVHPDRRIA